MAKSLMVLLVVVLAGLAMMPRRSVFDASRLSQIVWHDDDAYVFVGRALHGRNGSYVRYGLARISAFGDPPDDERESTTVLHITSRSVDQFQLAEAVPRLFVADGFVVSGESRWAGSGFEPYVPRQVPAAFRRPGTDARADGTAPVEHTMPLEAFTDVDGWSKQTFTVGYGLGEKAIQFSLADRPAALRIRVDDENRTIDLSRAGEPDVRLLTVSNRSRIVSSAEYSALFDGAAPH